MRPTKFHDFFYKFLPKVLRKSVLDVSVPVTKMQRQCKSNVSNSSTLSIFAATF